MNPVPEREVSTTAQREIPAREHRPRRSLVVLSDTESSLSLVRTVGELVAGTGRELVLLHIMSQERFDSRQRSINSIPSLRREGGYFIDQALESETRTASSAGRLALDGTNIPFVSVGEVGNVVPTVLATAKRYGCDHIFITSQPSHWRKSQPFDKSVRRIAAAFDGMLTVVKDSGVVIDIDAALAERNKTLLPGGSDFPATSVPDQRRLIDRGID